VAKHALKNFATHLCMDKLIVGIIHTQNRLALLTSILNLAEDTHTHGPMSGTTRVSRYGKVKPIWILLKQETVSGSGISWATRKSAPCSRQITMPAPHRSVFYRPDALPAAQPTSSKHLRQQTENNFGVVQPKNMEPRQQTVNQRKH